MSAAASLLLRALVLSSVYGAVTASLLRHTIHSGGDSHAPKELLHFQVVGDWGRQGEHNQTDVAEAMASAAQRQLPHFVISTGDNFYPSGLISERDPNFDESFTQVYGQPELQVPWYAVLGNHDYGDGSNHPLPEGCEEGQPGCHYGPLHQLSHRLVERDARWRCRRSRVLALAGGAVDIFFYDTTPFVQYYYDRTWASAPGGIAEQSWQANLAELEADLARSTAGWKVVVGHHPVRSNGIEHGDTPELLEHVEPLLERYGVQLALAGHDHDLEHIKRAGRVTHHLLSGAGSKCRTFAGGRDAVFQHAAAGFLTVTVHEDELVAEFYGIGNGSEAPLHTTAIPRQQHKDCSPLEHAHEQMHPLERPEQSHGAIIDATS